jgi:2OG-Fe(II) oxygenase superfamily
MPKDKATKGIPTANVAAPSKATAALPAGLILPITSNIPKQFSVEEILPGCVWVVHDFLKEEEWQGWIDYVEGSMKLEYRQHPATKYIANRECFRWQRNDTHIADMLFQRLQRCGILKMLESSLDFPKPNYTPIACNPNIRIYKYDKGMSFGKHVDESNVVDGLGKTEITVLVYLSGCQGGATRFYPSRVGKKRNTSVAFDPKPGAMLVHVHGDRCLEHEAEPVLQGRKYILRTDIVYRGASIPKVG